MSLDNKKVKEIAYLARLNLQDSEIEQTASELNNILSLMDKLGDIDTGDSETMAHPLKCLSALEKIKYQKKICLKNFKRLHPKPGKGIFSFQQ